MKILSLCFISIFLFFLACQKQAVTPSDQNELGEMSFKMSVANAPDDVIDIRGFLSRTSFDTIFFDFIMKDDSAYAFINDIVHGEWRVTVNAYSSSNVVIYSGSTNVYVAPGIVTPVFLHLNPVTGSLEIVVTWGNDIPADPALLAYYPFNGNAIDESGNGNDGNVFGAVLANDRFNNPNSAYSFDGVDDYISLPSDFDLPQRSISVWFNVTDLTKTQRIFYSDHPNLNYASTNIDIYGDSLTNGFKLRLEAGGGQAEDILYAIDENTWYHAVIIVDSQFTKAYVNGKYVNSVSFVNHHSINGFPNAFIGTSRNVDTYFFGGSIDDIRIYNYTLSHEEVLELFNEGL